MCSHNISVGQSLSKIHKEHLQFNDNKTSNIQIKGTKYFTRHFTKEDKLMINTWNGNTFVSHQRKES